MNTHYNNIHTGCFMLPCIRTQWGWGGSGYRFFFMLIRILKFVADQHSPFVKIPACFATCVTGVQ